MYTTDQYMETDNEPEAWAAFYSTCTPSILWDNGVIVAEKDFVEDELADSAVSMHEEISSDGLPYELEEVET